MKAVHNCKAGQQCHVKNHLCQIILRQDYARIKEAVKDPRFFCKNCGRAAHDAESLCNPSKV